MPIIPMNAEELLQKHNFPASATKIITDSGIKNFYPPQEAAIEKGVLEGKNLLLAIPTAAGKTLIAELCMIKAILQDDARCLYIAPLKALASEKFDEFKEKYEPLGIKVGIATGDFDSPTNFLNRYQILIATAEKVDSLLRFRAKWLIHNLKVVVLDEIHFINDGSRGPTLEILTARIKQLNANVQILALSATVSNAQEMADWLGAELVTSDWRPVPLKEGVYFNEQIVFNKHGVRLVKEEPEDDVSKLTLDTLRGKGQVLVFVNSRRSAQAASRLVSEVSAMVLTPEEKAELARIAKEILGSRDESTKICRKLADVIVCGAAFHHAGLKPGQRKLIENSFKKNLIKVICSTPTLAAGVNLPARRAIIRDCKRYEAGIGAAYIPAFEYKQCAGRAGRPKYDEYGEAVIIAKTFSESSALFDRYINAKTEPVISKLDNESALRMHILSSIAAGYVHDINEMFEFISHTFLAHQKRTGNLIEMISQIFDFLHKEDFVEKNGFKYFATPFGQCVSRLYIDPLTGIILRDGLKKAEEKRSFSAIGLLHLSCCCPDSELLHIGKDDYEKLEQFADGNHDSLIVTQNDVAALEDLYFYLASLKTTQLLYRWINEEKEETLCDDFGVGPGDIHRHVESTGWILYAAGVIADLFKFRNLTFTLEDLRRQVHYGIREELLELVSLKGVGRVRARNLFSKGFKRLSDLKLTGLDELAQIPQIGKTLAKDIQAQAEKLSKA
ncbi:MAG: DEAD/DEAH box helicase [Candidatus Omnitrophota bacterium]